MAWRRKSHQRIRKKILKGRKIVKNANEWSNFEKNPKRSPLPADLSLEAGGKPSTWFPPGGLVEHYCSIFYALHCLEAPEIIFYKIFKKKSKFLIFLNFSNSKFDFGP